MKKVAALVSLGTYLSLTLSAFAQGPVRGTGTGLGGQPVDTCPAGNFGGLCNITLSNIIPGLVTTIFILAIVVALFYLIWGGFKWLTSGGDKGQVQAAREHIVAAIIGLIIIFLSHFILNIFLNFFL